jgi:hypothetical protein
MTDLLVHVPVPLLLVDLLDPNDSRLTKNNRMV